MVKKKDQISFAIQAANYKNIMYACALVNVYKYNVRKGALHCGMFISLLKTANMVPFSEGV